MSYWLTCMYLRTVVLPSNNVHRYIQYADVQYKLMWAIVCIYSTVPGSKARELLCAVCVGGDSTECEVH